jgi:hypothetical protein
MAAKRDLARRLEIPEADIEVLSIEQIEISYESDCPPLQNCPQRAFPGPRIGYLIRLQASGEVYEYRMDGLRKLYYQE